MRRRPEHQERLTDPADVKIQRRLKPDSLAFVRRGKSLGKAGRKGIHLFLRKAHGHSRFESRQWEHTIRTAARRGAQPVRRPELSWTVDSIQPSGITPIMAAASPSIRTTLRSGGGGAFLAGMIGRSEPDEYQTHISVFAPMPNARETTATTAKPGLLRSIRTAWRMVMREVYQFPDGGAPAPLFRAQPGACG